MARLVLAPEEIKINFDDEISIFLAGGITGVENWQKKAIDVLMKEFKNIPLIIFSPRRDNFPINDPNAALEQIKWEYEALEICDIFSMYFGSGNSDQPICMYEYGKHLQKYEDGDYDYNQFIVTAEKDYKRYQDVIIQTTLVDPLLKVNTSLDEHIQEIIKKVYLTLDEK